MTINIYNQTPDSETINSTFNLDQLQNCIDTLDLYNIANSKKPANLRLSYTEFYNDGVNKELELKSHFERWKRGINFCKRNKIQYKKSKNFTL